MSLLSDLYSKKNTYENFRNNLYILKDNLNQCNSSFSGVSQSIKENCNIDNYSKQSDKISSNHDDIKNKISILENIIIPAVSSEISNINKQIDAEEKRIADEKAKEEEQRKKDNLTNNNLDS